MVQHLLYGLCRLNNIFTLVKSRVKIKVAFALCTENAPGLKLAINNICEVLNVKKTFQMECFNDLLT